MPVKKKDGEPLNVRDFFRQFPNEAAAVGFFEGKRWPDGACCPHCGSVKVATIANAKPMPYRCKGCRKHFSVRTGSVLAASKLPLQKWLMAAYLMTTSRKGISGVQLARHLGVTQKTAWFLEHRIREALAGHGGLMGPDVEIDEACIGGRERNKHNNRKRKAGRGAVGKQAVRGMQERTGAVRALPVSGTGKTHLQSAIVENIRRGRHHLHRLPWRLPRPARLPAMSITL